VITSLIGAIVGIGLGSLLAVAVGQPLVKDGFVVSFPVGTLIALVVLAALAGVVTAIGPARRAARLDVLRALAYE
jgi:putative ABC transport system permease protein